MQTEIHIGIDWATNRFHAISFQNAKIIQINSFTSKIKPSEDKGFDKRRVEVADAFKAFLEALPAEAGSTTYLHVEAPITANSAVTGRALAMGAGALYYAYSQVGRSDLIWSWVHVSKWKAMVGKDKSKKAAKDYFVNLYGEIENGTEDHYDAGCIGIYGFNSRNREK